MLEKTISKLFILLDDEGWMRHANPLSGWTRVPCFGLLVLAFWSRVWLGWYFTIPIILIALWIWVNPRIFPKPKSTNNWMSKVVLGERVWLNRDKIPIPEHHRLVPKILFLIGTIGLVPTIWGFCCLNVWMTLLGVSWCYFSKFWFVDRMVWLFEDMKHLPEYKNWLSKRNGTSLRSVPYYEPCQSS